jgi:hypothetical protein
MAFTNSNDFITGRRPVVFPAGIEVVAERFMLALAVGDLALNSIGQIGILPAGCVPVEVRVDGDDLDSGAGAGVYQVGILDAAGTAISSAAADGGGAWGDTGTAVATAFDKPITRTLNNMAKVQKSDVDRKIGLKVTTAPSTAVAGTIGVTVFYKAA